MTDYDHVMYASPSHIREIFSTRFNDVSQKQLGKSETKSSSIGGKLNFVLGKIDSGFSGDVGREEIHTINFDEEFRQVKKVVNDLLNDDEIPDVTQLSEHSDKHDLFRFNSEVMVKPTKGEFDDRNYVEVIGLEDEIRFRGITSLENWGSRSDLLIAYKAMEQYDTYPFQGVLTPNSRINSMPDEDEWRVNFLFICSPDRASRTKWHNRQALKQELPYDENYPEIEEFEHWEPPSKSDN